MGRRKLTEIQRSDTAQLHHGMRKTPYTIVRDLRLIWGIPQGWFSDSMAGLWIGVSAWSGDRFEE